MEKEEEEGRKLRLFKTDLPVLISDMDTRTYSRSSLSFTSILKGIGSNTLKFEFSAGELMSMEGKIPSLSSEQEEKSKRKRIAGIIIRLIKLKLSKE